jgi:2-dehydropantoate 2-reductase
VPVRVCIVGCGAIGGLFAAHLARLDGVEVWAFDPAVEHVDAINHDGLRLTGRLEWSATVHARTDASEIPPCELGIVAAKGTATERAIAATAGAFRDAAVCSVQNGIGNEEIIAAHIARVIRGVTLESGSVQAPGVIHVDAAGPTWIGPFDTERAGAAGAAGGAGVADSERLGELLNRAGMETRVLADVRGAQWTKVVFNAATNPLCALTGLTHGALCAFPPTAAVVAALIDEAKAVARALEIEFDEDPAVLNERAARLNPDHRPSMLQDVQRRRPTEIATLNGGIVDAGRRTGVATPLHASVAALIEGLERSWAIPGASGSPPAVTRESER